MSLALVGFAFGVLVGCGFAWASLTIIGLALAGFRIGDWSLVLEVIDFSHHLWLLWAVSGAAALALHYRLFVTETVDALEAARSLGEETVEGAVGGPEPEVVNANPEGVEVQKKKRTPRASGPRRKTVEQEVKERVRGILVRVKSVAQLNVECQRLKDAYAADQHALIDRLFRQEIEAVRERGFEA